MVAKVAPLVVIVGETASGKSDLAIELAKQFNGEIICADSRTIYKSMDIGTAKPSKKDQLAVRHHLIDVIEPGERYSAAQFKADALKAIADIAGRGKLPIMVGGTGLYIDAVIFDYGFGVGSLPRDPNNPRHLSQDVPRQTTELRSRTLVVGLQRDRSELNERIQKRTEQMVQGGFIEEVKTLLNKYGSDNEAMSGIGYRTFVKYINGELSLEDAKVEFVRGDKSLAKRQRTWFKRNKSIHWIEPSQAQKLVENFLT